MPSQWSRLSLPHTGAAVAQWLKNSSTNDWVEGLISPCMQSYFEVSPGKTLESFMCQNSKIAAQTCPALKSHLYCSTINTFKCAPWRRKKDFIMIFSDRMQTKEMKRIEMWCDPKCRLMYVCSDSGTVVWPKVNCLKCEGATDILHHRYFHFRCLKHISQAVNRCKH